MPGAYAHMTLVNLLREPARLEAIPGFPNEAISAVLEYFRFTELGAVSPDYSITSRGTSSASIRRTDMRLSFFATRMGNADY